MSKQSKFLSRILRHEPDVVGLTLATGGWVHVDDLLRGMKKAGHRLTLDELRQIVAENDKQRFTLSKDGRRIRAAQGHSIAVDLRLDPTKPPPILFHGTESANLDAIFASGLTPGRRQHVHLSSDQDTAVTVGARHGRPIVLRIDTGVMHADGFIFWRADSGVWLTPTVPPRYLGF